MSGVSKRRFAYLLLTSILLPTPNYAASPMVGMDADNAPMELCKSFEKLTAGGERNQVLNELKIALDAYQLGHKEIAKEYFDLAILKIESVFSNTEDAAKARSLWYSEGMKTFRGEPYERVMAYYYRGLLYMLDKDFENARASFKSSLFQDTLAEETQYVADFALPIMMEAVASKFNNDIKLLETPLEDLSKLRPTFVFPKDFNTVILIETGNSPRKLADGIGHYELKFRRGKNFEDVSVEYSIDSKDFQHAFLIEDIFWQATTRGGREVDGILKNKAMFQETTGGIATTLGGISSTATILSPINGLGKLGAAGAGLGIVSGISLLASVNTDATADTRFWNNLPDKVHVVLAKLPSGNHKINLRFKDASGNVLDSLNRTETISINDKYNFIQLFSRTRISHTFKELGE